MDILIEGNIQGAGNILTITPENIAFTKITKSSLRLIVNETAGKVLYRHMAHDNITDISYDDENKKVNITFASSVPVMAASDVFSIKLYVQKEDIIPTDYAKEASVSYNIQQISNIQNYLQDTIAKETTVQQIASDAAAAKIAAQNAETTAQATANKNEIIAQIQANAGIPTLTIPDTTAEQILAPNVLYIFSTRTSTLTLTLGTPIVGIANEYHFFIECGETAPTINFPRGIQWNGGSTPTITTGNTYEVSILDGVAAFIEVEPLSQS